MSPRIGAALWKWDLDADTCSICRNIVMMPCIDCTSKSSINCSISWGACTHAFHTHCLDRWLKVRNACPIGTFSLLPYSAHIHPLVSSYPSQTTLAVFRRPLNSPHVSLNTLFWDYRRVFSPFIDNQPWVLKRVSSANNG